MLQYVPIHFWRSSVECAFVPQLELGSNVALIVRQLESINSRALDTPDHVRYILNWPKLPVDQKKSSSSTTSTSPRPTRYERDSQCGCDFRSSATTFRRQISSGTFRIRTAHRHTPSRDCSKTSTRCSHSRRSNGA
jgi:hypothetical protein